MAFNSRYRNPPNAFQQLKRAGSVVTGLSGVALLWTVTGLVVDQEKLVGVLFVCMSLWGLATGVGLLRLQPWSRFSMLVFHSLLCICAVSSVVLLVVLVLTTPNKGIVAIHKLGLATFVTVWFVLISVTIGVRGLLFFRRNDIRVHFGGIR
jgi:uncharacterized membrane protein